MEQTNPLTDHDSLGKADGMGKVEHFEIPADDVSRAKSFYAEVFGWAFEDWDDETTMIKPGGKPGDTGVIGGDIHKRSAVPHPTVVITVENVEDAIAAIEKAGGRLIGAIHPFGESARYAYFEDSEGNQVGLYDGTI